MPRLKQFFISFLVGTSIIFFGSASTGIDDELKQIAERTQIKLNKLHDANSNSNKIKQFDLILNSEGFLRYRRTFIGGKEEYYSFNLMRLKSIHYLGNTSAGDLTIQTMEDDVIVQTFNDRAGNVDSMSTHFRLPLIFVEAEDLVALQHDMLKMKRILDQEQK